MATENYRYHAAQCLQVDESSTDATTKSTMLDMASAWLRLAEQADKNSTTDVVYETPAVRPTASPPDTPAL